MDRAVFWTPAPCEIAVSETNDEMSGLAYRLQVQTHIVASRLVWFFPFPHCGEM